MSDQDLTALARVTGVLDTRRLDPLSAERRALRRARQRQEALNVIALATSVGAILFVAILGGLA